MPSRGLCKLLACLPLGVNTGTEVTSIVLVLNANQTVSFTKHNLQNSFSTIPMDQTDHHPDLQGTPRELAGAATENPPSVGFLSLKAPTNDMHQVIWGVNEVPMPSIEPNNEGSGASPLTQAMADIPPISTSCIQCGCVEYVSRDTPSHRSLILSCSLALQVR